MARSAQTYELTCPVVFVGFMGAGKSTLSRRLARTFGLSAVDTDLYFANEANMSAGDYIREYGEDAFRTQETAVLKRVLAMEPALISCGGGIVVTAENRELLRDRFVVYLQITADEARSRISNLNSRPLFGDEQAARDLLAGREALYEEVATVTVDTSGKTLRQVCRLVEQELKERGVLCPQ